jgi:hypothetical protein
VEVHIDRDARRVALSGPINEHADFAPLRSEVKPGLVIDLGGITRINSAGAREWIKFMAEVPPRSLVLERCPVSFVNQLNLIANFVVGAQVSSVFVPFICPACNSTRDELRPLSTANSAAPPRCQCGTPMEFDIDPAQYFAFAGSGAA